MTGFSGEDIKLNEIFSFDQTGITENGEVKGSFKTHSMPKVINKIEAKGIKNIRNIFE